MKRTVFMLLAVIMLFNLSFFSVSASSTEEDLKINFIDYST